MKIEVTIIIILLSIVFIIGIDGCESEKTYAEQSGQGGIENEKIAIEQPKEIKFYFYDLNTNCSLNGDLFLEGVFLGKAANGFFTLKEEDYKTKFKINSNVSISGLTDNCFGKDSNLPFFESWSVPDLAYYFENNLNVPFEAGLTPRSPRYIQEMQGFIRPNETANFINERKQLFIGSSLENIKKIGNSLDTKFYYKTDLENFKVEDYWETPAETLKREGGDCEDWTNTFLSATLYYNSSLKCYNVRLPTHLTNFCYLGDGQYSLIDQQGIQITVKIYKNGYVQDELKKMREFVDGYLRGYGISVSESAIYYAYNNKEFKEFSDNEDFIKWAFRFTFPYY
jgi:predicted transglutaminase-like cysteine proteinase